MNKVISKHISWYEATKTSSKYDNTPSEDELANMRAVAELVFEPIREHFNVPIRVNSFYRSSKVNYSIGGASKSQHVKGQAIDIDAISKITNADIFNYVKNNLEYDQLIAENIDDNTIGWIHISYNCEYNRKQNLVMYNNDGKKIYSKYNGSLSKSDYI